MPRYNNVRELPSGKWQARYVGPDGARFTALFDSASAASDWVTSQKSDLHAGEWCSPLDGKTPFGVWLNTYLASRIDVRASTKARDTSYVATHIRPAFAAVPIANIAQPDVALWVGTLATKLKPSSVASVYGCFRGVMTAAVEARLIKSSPCYSIRLPRLNAEERRFLTPAEIAGLSEAMRAVSLCKCKAQPCESHTAERYSALVLVGCYGGLRIGELAGLNRSHFNPATRRLRVEQQATEAQNVLEIGELKTRAARRVVALPRFVADALSAHMRDFTGTENDSPLFPGGDGARLRANNLRRREWKAACEAVGLLDFRMHDMRHTAVALWIATGAPALQVSRQAGHSNVAFTLQRYGHLYDDAADDLANGLDAIAADTLRPAVGGNVVPIR